MNRVAAHPKISSTAVQSRFSSTHLRLSQGISISFKGVGHVSAVLTAASKIGRPGYNCAGPRSRHRPNCAVSRCCPQKIISPGPLLCTRMNLSTLLFIVMQHSLRLMAASLRCSWPLSPVRIKNSSRSTRRYGAAIKSCKLQSEFICPVVQSTEITATFGSSRDQAGFLPYLDGSGPTVYRLIQVTCAYQRNSELIHFITHRVETGCIRPEWRLPLNTTRESCRMTSEMVITAGLDKVGGNVGTCTRTVAR